MTDTARRALLGAIVSAPALGVAAHAAAAPVAADLAALDTDALLRYGATLSDAAFASLCADALEARARSDAAGDAIDAAEEAADADTPPFPTDLTWRSRYRDPRTGETTIGEHRWNGHDDRGGMMLWNLSHWLKAKAGISYAEAEARLRAAHADWTAARNAARARHHVEALTEASMEAGRAAIRALDAAIAYPARGVPALLVQLHLRRSECLPPDGEDELAAFVAHVERALI